MKTRSASSRSAALARTNARGTTGTLKSKTLTAKEFDAKFDGGEDMTAHVDWASARRPGREVQRVNVDFPVDLLRAIDQEARRIGVTRQAFIKLRLADTLVAR